jgi:hypothetical protein
VSEPRRRVNPNQALRRCIWSCTTQGVRCPVHIAGDRKRLGPGDGQHKPFRASLDKFAAQTVLKGMKASGDRSVVHTQRAGRC